MTEGTARLRGGAVAEAMAVLDEAMLPVQAGRVPPDVAGNLYCQMIAICWELADLRRAREWTAATERWCASFDSSVMFSGICRMHRVQLHQVAGEWDFAAEEARVVCTELVGMNIAVVAEGHYLLGDLLRLRGQVADAEAAYLRAHELGRDPQPGLALLKAQTGQVGLQPWRRCGRPWPGTAEASTGGLRCSGRWWRLRSTPRIWTPHATAADELAAVAQRWRSDGLCAPRRHMPGAWSSSPPGNRRGPSRPSAKPSPGGGSWTRRTTVRGRGSCSPRRCPRSATTPRPGWSSMSRRTP